MGKKKQSLVNKIRRYRCIAIYNERSWLLDDDHNMSTSQCFLLRLFSPHEYPAFYVLSYSVYSPSTVNHVFWMKLDCVMMLI